MPISSKGSPTQRGASHSNAACSPGSEKVFSIVNTRVASGEFHATRLMRSSSDWLLMAYSISVRVRRIDNQRAWALGRHGVPPATCRRGFIALPLIDEAHALVLEATVWRAHAASRAARGAVRLQWMVRAD